MRDDLEQQEQMDALKAFWDQWGNLITGVITLIALALAAWNGWNWWQVRKAQEAASVYSRFEDAAKARNLTAVKDVSGVLFDKYPGTLHASLAALNAARVQAEAGDLAAARTALEWAAAHGADDGIKAVASVRLAGVMLDQGQFDEALKVLDRVGQPSFAGMVADRRGDILVASGKPDEARKAWGVALEKLEKTSALRQQVQLKLDALGQA